MKRSTAWTAFLLLAFAPVAQAEAQVAAATAPQRALAVAPVPFGPGEKFVYGVKWGILGRRGTATSEVVKVESIRGNPSYHLSFHLQGSVLGLGVNDLQESWLDVARLYSHRFRQDLDQPRYERLRTLDFFPADKVWKRVEKDESGPLASDRPLDDVSFLYWSRTLPLEVGKSYTFQRYFKESGNPVTIRVLRKERVTVPAGTFNTIVVKPLIRTSGLFGDGGEAEVYYTDDARRLIVQVKTKLPIASAVLQLEKYVAGDRL